MRGRCYIQWLEELKDKVIEPDLGNAVIYDNLIQHRRSASVYLQKFSGDITIQLVELAELYRKMADQILQDENTVYKSIIGKKFIKIINFI